MAGLALLDQGLVAGKEEPPRTSSIYATNTWSGRVGEAKYKKRNAKSNKRECFLSHSFDAAHLLGKMSSV